MSRPLRSLIPLLWPVFLLLVAHCFCILFWLNLLDPLREKFLSVYLCLMITALFTAPYLAYIVRYRWLWRFGRYVRRFATVENTRIVLHYEPGLEGKEAISLLLSSCQTELDSLARLFGSPLRKRVNVFLFTHWRDIRAIFGPAYGGLAISQANAIFIARDNCVPESMRHELVHLFSLRWNVFAPPLLSEGLSVFLQGTFWRQPIDSVALPLVRQGSPKLSLLLRSAYFFAEPQRRSCYILAGSFTGFLIRRYGWDCFRKLYRSCDGGRFRAKFQKYIGVSLEKAEWQWRNELIVMPILNRRLGRKPHC